jgi:hypothetical protein
MKNESTLCDGHSQIGGQAVNPADPRAAGRKLSFAPGCEAERVSEFAGPDSAKLSILLLDTQSNPIFALNSQLNIKLVALLADSS